MQKHVADVKAAVPNGLLIQYEHDWEEHNPDAAQCEWLGCVIGCGQIDEKR